MSTLELFSYILEIPSDAYTTSNQNLIGCSTFSKVKRKLIGFLQDNNEKATLNINMSYSFVQYLEHGYF